LYEFASIEPIENGFAKHVLNEVITIIMMKNFLKILILFRYITTIHFPRQ